MLHLLRKICFAALWFLDFFRFWRLQSKYFTISSLREQIIQYPSGRHNLTYRQTQTHTTLQWPILQPLLNSKVPLTSMSIFQEWELQDQAQKVLMKMRCYFNRLNVRLNTKIEGRQVWGLNPREDWHLKCCHWITALHVGWGNLLLGGVSPLKEGKTGTSQLGLWTISLLANWWSRPDVNSVKKVYCPTLSFTVESSLVFKTPADTEEKLENKPENTIKRK